MDPIAVRKQHDSQGQVQPGGSEDPVAVPVAEYGFGRLAGLAEQLLFRRQYREV